MDESADVLRWLIGRAAGSAPFAELRDGLGWPRDELRRRVDRLAAEGLVEWGAGAERPVALTERGRAAAEPPVPVSATGEAVTADEVERYPRGV